MEGEGSKGEGEVSGGKWGAKWGMGTTLNTPSSNETVQRENTSIIIKVNACSFEWCMVCLSKMSLR